MFTEAEIEFLDSQILARVATVDRQAQPDVAPVGLHREGDVFLVTGHDLPSTLKYRNVKGGSSKMALVVDDQPSVQPWIVRGIKLHGSAEILTGGREKTIRFTPHRKWSWGIN
jgi:pyridoxamine 5'-phosphate oxidase family protein